jgi:hypothetical protein
MREAIKVEKLTSIYPSTYTWLRNSADGGSSRER